jgi:hypothetical protein
MFFLAPEQGFFFTYFVPRPVRVAQRVPFADEECRPWVRYNIGADSFYAPRACFVSRTFAWEVVWEFVRSRQWSPAVPWADRFGLEYPYPAGAIRSLPTRTSPNDPLSSWGRWESDEVQKRTCGPGLLQRMVSWHSTRGAAPARHDPIRRGPYSAAPCSCRLYLASCRTGASGVKGSHITPRTTARKARWGRYVVAVFGAGRGTGCRRTARRCSRGK